MCVRVVMGVVMGVVIVPMFVRMNFRRFKSLSLSVGPIGTFDAHVELYTFNVRLVPAPDVKLVTFKWEFAEFGVEAIWRHPEVDHGADKHIAADAAEDVEIKTFHVLVIRPSCLRRPRIIKCSRRRIFEF